MVPSKVALATRNMNRYEQCLDLGSRPFRKACDGPCHVARLFSRVLEILCIAVICCALLCIAVLLLLLQVLP